MGLPALEGVEHRFVTTAGGIRIHVALAGPQDGRPLMLVHGFPQHWWEWHHLLAPLAAEGYRVIVPDLRGAGWSDAPRGPYFKSDMGDDLAVVIDALGTGPVKVAAHDWGGPVAFCMMLNHPGVVSGFLGLNTIAPVLTLDATTVRHLWTFWYQIPFMTPVVGPRLLAARGRRLMRFVVSWVGGGYEWSDVDADLYYDRLREPERAEAASQWYRTFQLREAVPWIAGRYKSRRVDVPLRWVTGLDDPVVTPVLHRSYGNLSNDLTFEEVPGVGHWIVEQAPDLVLGRLRDLMSL